MEQQTFEGEQCNCYILNRCDYTYIKRELRECEESICPKLQNDKPKKSCYNCTCCSMCKVRHDVFMGLPFNTTADDYNKKFSLLYETIAMCCTVYNHEVNQ